MWPRFFRNAFQQQSTLSLACAAPVATEAVFRPSHFSGAVLCESPTACDRGCDAYRTRLPRRAGGPEPDLPPRYYDKRPWLRGVRRRNEIFLPGTTVCRL
jgi:hypothetical protein